MVSRPSYLASRSEQLQEQDFSSEVTERIAPHQRPSTRAIYQLKWAFFKKMMQRILDGFLQTFYKASFRLFMHFFQNLNRHPATVDGYRTAIWDSLGRAGLQMVKYSDLNRLISSFHRQT